MSQKNSMNMYQNKLLVITIVYMLVRTRYEQTENSKIAVH